MGDMQRPPNCYAIRCKHAAKHICCLLPGEICPLINAKPNWLKFNKDVSNYLYKRTGVRVTAQTIKKWCKTGKISYSNCRVYLLSIKRFGNKWYTTTQWIDKFIREVSE